MQGLDCRRFLTSPDDQVSVRIKRMANLFCQWYDFLIPNFQIKKKMIVEARIFQENSRTQAFVFFVFFFLPSHSCWAGIITKHQKREQVFPTARAAQTVSLWGEETTEDVLRQLTHNSTQARDDHSRAPLSTAEVILWVLALLITAHTLCWLGTNVSQMSLAGSELEILHPHAVLQFLLHGVPPCALWHGRSVPCTHTPSLGVLPLWSEDAHLCSLAHVTSYTGEFIVQQDYPLTYARRNKKTNAFFFLLRSG